jgi:membrane-bound ClpP family serine protease
VTNIEIREIIPPPEWQEARKPQIIAERIQSLLGVPGETQTTVQTTGTILIGNQSWDAISNELIPPGSKVRIKRVIFEVEGDLSTNAP